MSLFRRNPPQAAGIQAAIGQEATAQSRVLVDEGVVLFIDTCLQGRGQSGYRGMFAIRGGGGYCVLTAANWEDLGRAFSILDDRYTPAGFTVRLRVAHTDTTVARGRVGQSQEVAGHFRSEADLTDYMWENDRELRIGGAEVCLEIGTPSRLGQ